MKRLFFGGLAALLAACGTLRTKPFILVEQKGSAVWEVTWHFREPVEQARFKRFAGGIRRQSFEVLTPGWSIVSEAGGERLQTNGPPSQRVTVRIREFRRQLEREYDLFEFFSDGSVALYTGHFLLQDDSIKQYRFRSAPERPIILEGERHTGSVQWFDQEGQGTYVYFGSIEPVVTPEMITVIDPGMPDWLERRTRAMLPRLFAFFTERFGAPLPKRPVVLFSYRDANGSGYSSGGGTLPNVIQLGLEGQAWRTESAEGMLHQFHFLAHEAAHLWNGQLIHHRGRDDAWMHEGSADGLAERALLQLGLIDEERYRHYQTSAVNDCLRGMNRVYACGNVVAFLTEQSIRGDLFDFWRAMIEHTRRGTDAFYEAEDYFSVLRSMGADDDALSLVRDVARGRVAAADMIAALRRKGMILIEEEPPQTFGQSLAREALVHLLSEHCSGPIRFRSTPRGFVLDPESRCAGLEANAVIRTVDGLDALREGHRVWDRLHERCGSSTPVQVDGSTLECKKTLPPRQPYVRVAGFS